MRSFSFEGTPNDAASEHLVLLFKHNLPIEFSHENRSFGLESGESSGDIFSSQQLFFFLSLVVSFNLTLKVGAFRNFKSS